MTLCSNVFVYGTLKKGMGNHDLLGDSDFLGECVIPGTLINLGAFPAYIITEEKGTVTGEVYELKEPVFLTLDRLEGYPDFYNRVLRETPFGEAWVYYIPASWREDYSYEIIESGVWTPELREKPLWL